MARKQASFVAQTGRDQGKEFLITEMSASNFRLTAHRTANIIFISKRYGYASPKKAGKAKSSGLIKTAV